MQEKKEYLSKATQAILSVLFAATILFAFGSNYYILAIIGVVSMAILKYYAVKCYNKKLDKFYFIAFVWMTIMLIILEIMRRS